VVKILFLLVFLILIGNLLFLDVIYVQQKEQVADAKLRIGTLADSFKLLSEQVAEERPQASTPAAQIQQIQTTNACPQSCVTAFNAAIANVKPGATTVTKTTTLNQKGEYVIPLGSGVGTKVGSWEDVYTAQGNFDTANFGPIRAFYFEVVMHTTEGEVKAKLVDDTTPFSYDGQVLSTTSSTGQLLSVQVPLIAGKKTYHVKLYSTISVSASLDSARIRIVTE